MNIKREYLLAFIFIFYLSSYGQNIGAEEIDETNVQPWLVKDFREYQGVYHFGENDGSQLILLFIDSTVIVQLRDPAYWSQGGFYVKIGLAHLSELDSKWEFLNLTNLTIKGNKFYSDQYEGEFVTYSDSTLNYSGLKINNPWNTWVGIGRYEIGIKLQSFDTSEWFPGKYPQTSIRLLCESDLDTITSEELKMMRNEIFARYGYIFKNDSEMEVYFTQQEWYCSRYDDVSGFLTALELANINIIKRLEAQR